MINWILFFLLTSVTYFCISYIGQATGGTSTSVWESVAKIFSPQILVIILISNLFFGAALFYGFSATKYAIPIALSTGVVIGFLYSLFVLQNPLSPVHILGLLCIFVGIFLLN